MENLQLLAERIKAACDQKRITVNKMLKESGAGERTYHNILAGSSPSSDKLSKIADYLDVSVDYLLGRDEKKTIPDTDLKFALFRGADNITDEMYDEVLKFADYVKEKYKK